jgi:hypothetical protein
MQYIILIVVLLIPIAMIAGLVYAYKKLPRAYFLLLIFTLVAGPFAAFKSYEKSSMLSVIPDGLHITAISYSKEESWGFGPGGNEAGIRVYPLSEQIENEISQRGIEFFNNLPPNQDQQDRRWRGSYEAWSQTPINATKYWQVKEETGKLDIYDYICAYGFCIDIKPAVVTEANEIINSEGSYYAYGRIGVIVVSPSKRLVLYMYNG